MTHSVNAITIRWPLTSVDGILVPSHHFLDRFDIPSDYRVLPVVGLVSTPVEWRIDQREVAEIFSVPLSIATNRDHYQRREYRRGQLRYIGYSMEWEGHTIWGATAAMLLNLGDRLLQPQVSEIA